MRTTAVVVVIALAALAVIYHERSSSAQTFHPQPKVELPPVQAAPHADPIPALLPKRSSTTVAVPLVPFQGTRSILNSPGDAAKEAETEASAGSPDAMHTLATALRECARANMASNDVIEQRVARQSVGREILRGDGRRGNPAEDATEVKRLEGIRDSCLQIPKVESDQWVKWLEKAANSGDSAARFDFAWLALEEFPTQADKEENAEEYLRRRDEAFGLLQDSVANGDCSSGIFNGFRKVSPDPLSQFVYEGLLLQHALDYYSTSSLPADVAANEIQSVQSTLNNLAVRVPIDQRGLAQATIRDILQNYCKQF